MNQSLTIFLSAIIIGVVSVAVLAGYTSVRASKLPENPEIIQIFISGSIVGSFVAWLVTSGFLHGSSLFNMLSADVSSVAKEIGLKGGDDSVINSFEAPEVAEVVESAKNSVNKNVNIPALTGMVGGFFKSIGLDDKTLKELNVGMPTF
jgi:flagellar biosynthesis protein FliQ